MVGDGLELVFWCSGTGAEEGADGGGGGQNPFPLRRHKINLILLSTEISEDKFFRIGGGGLCYVKDK
jgi:hypothetical protein